MESIRFYSVTEPYGAFSNFPAHPIRLTNDRYWGDGGDGHGSNRLGALLMELRASLRAESSKGASSK